jgi:anaerobic magnesium-protoporphyrin IX monomethyl ester cyclase
MSVDAVPRVALVYPYFRTHAATELLFAPLGVAALAAQLERAGIEARVFDGTFTSVDALGEAIVAYRPAIVGVSVMVTLTGNALRVAEAVRRDLPDSLLVAGGPLPTVFPARYAGSFDVVFRGEADLSFPRFCADYLARATGPVGLGELPLAGYAGLFVARDGLRLENPTVHHSEAELASFPLPDRDDFDHAAYQRVWSEKAGNKPTSLLATLGCPYHCDFCSRPVFGTAVRRRGLDAVFAEIAEIAALGYDRLWIADDLFTLDHGYLETFCRRIADTGLGWSCLARADGTTPQVARLMAASGCRRVYLGLESGSPATLTRMRKHITVSSGVEAVRVYHDVGIEVAAFFIVGYPGETVEDIELTFDHALRLPLDDVSFNVPLPLPGSDLFERLGRPDDGTDWRRENEVTFVFETDLDQEWLRRRIDETMAAFAARRRRSPAAVR